MQNLLISETFVWARHVARMCKVRGRTGSCWGNRKEGDHWGILGLYGWIILWWVSMRWDEGTWTGLGCPGLERVGGSLWVR